MKNNYLISTLLFFLFHISLAQQINSINLKKHIKFLASNKMQGREVATQQELSAANYIRSYFSMLKLEPKGNISSYYYSYKFKKYKNPNDTIGGEIVSSINVVAYLDNNEKSTVIIGAHFDHLGIDKNSLHSDLKRRIYNGADDNASGTAGVLELARYFSQNKRKEKFNFLFICFSGGEQGLVGSRKFCENPTIDFSKVNYMINMDMIGRLNDTTKKVIVSGVGTSIVWDSIADRVPTDLQIIKDYGGFGGSDQTSFYFKQLPVLSFNTVMNSDYHQPGDDVEKINFAGEKKVLEYIAKVIEETEKRPKLKFLETTKSENETCKFIIPN